MNTRLSTALAGAMVAALCLSVSRAEPPPATPPAARSVAASQARSRRLEHLEARMRLLQEQMRRIHETKNPAERSRLLREHMQTMIAQMRAMRPMGGQMMYGMMGRRGMRGGMRGRGTMGGGMMGGGPMGGGSTRAMPSRPRRWMQDRLDMMQMMMEQMMGQMQAMEGMYMGGPRRSRK